MASSGSDNFTVNRNEIIEESLRDLRVLSIAETPTAEHISYGARKLNLIVKQWMGSNDFAPGLKVWSRKRGFLFPAYNDAEYSIGPSGDHATASYSSTTISADEAAGQTVLSVTSTTGMTAADNIGIVQNDGTIHWSTISSTGAGPTVTIASGLTAAAAAGKTVYWYTTKLVMPLEMLSVRRRDSSNNETPLTPMLLPEYEDGIPNKTNLGTPTRYLYETGITNGTLRFDRRLDTVSYIYLLTFLRKIEDFDASTDTPDYPAVWYRPLVMQLVIDQAPMYGKPVTPEMRNGLNEALAIARHADPENVVAFFESERC